MSSARLVVPYSGPRPPPWLNFDRHCLPSGVIGGGGIAAAIHGGRGQGVADLAGTEWWEVTTTGTTVIHCSRG